MKWKTQVKWNFFENISESYCKKSSNIEKCLLSVRSLSSSKKWCYFGLLNSVIGHDSVVASAGWR